MHIKLVSDVSQLFDLSPQNYGQRHLSLNIRNVEFNINVPLGEMIRGNLMLKIEMSTYHCVAMSIQH